jgi:putative DNA-invertase from lambdoid prophage Rac
MRLSRLCRAPNPCAPLAARRRTFLGREPSFPRTQFVQVRDLLSQEAVGIARIAKETGLTRQTIYRIQG